MADIFVSYTNSDKEWAFWIGLELEKLGHAPHIHEWEISAGGDIPAWMEDRIQKADRVLSVVSSIYLTKDYSSWERRSAQWAAQRQRPNFLFLVFVDDCEAPIALAHVKRCDLFGVSEDDARARLKTYLEPPAKPIGPARFPGASKPAPSPTAKGQAVSFPGAKFALSNIPIFVPRHFLGRDEAIEAIDAGLKRYEGRVAITALHGLRGVGKTTLAAAYAERHRGDYRATWWIRAQTADTMRADLAALGVRLGWVAADEKEEPALDRVRERLRHEGAGLLLIYDNATSASNLRPYLPMGGAARVLVTSNAHAWRGVAAPVEVRLWPVNIGADYLIARTGREGQRADAEMLSEALGGLPLAHEQAAAYCERLEISLAEYRQRFEATPERLLGGAKDAPAEYHDRLTVAKAFDLAIEEAAKLHPAAEPLIAHAALLAPEPIPLFLFSEGRESLGEPLSTLLADDGLDEAVAALRAFALVDRELIPDERNPAIVTETIRLHRLVRIAAALRRQGEAVQAARLVLIDAMAAVYPDNVFNDPGSWPRARRLDSIAFDLVCGASLPPEGAQTGASYVLDRLGSYRQGALGTYAQARPLFERALEIHEKLGSNHPGTATRLNNLARLLHAQGDLSGARPLYERALEIREKALGPEHAQTSKSLNNLANLLQDQGDLTGAQALVKRALAIYGKLPGPEDQYTATSLNTLALLLQAQADLAGARPLFERALAIREKVRGPEHADTTASLNNLANLLQAQGDLEAAAPLHVRALSTRERALGSEHPLTAQSLNNLASLRQAQGDLAGAQQLFERALGIREKALDPQHPDTNLTRANLASLRLARGAPIDALALSEAALAAHHEVLGSDHPSTKRSAGVKADALAVLGRVDDAAALRVKYGLDDGPLRAGTS